MLYTTTDIKTNSLIPSTLEDRMLLSIFDIVEKVNINALLGSELLSELTLQVKDNNVSVENQSLLDELKTLYTVACMYQGLTFWNIRVFKTGVGKQLNSHIENIDKDYDKSHSDDLLESLQSLEKSMQEWLIENNIDYPLYNSKTQPQIRKTGGFYLPTNKC
jgi:hypothetical protein